MIALQTSNLLTMRRAHISLEFGGQICLASDYIFRHLLGKNEILCNTNCVSMCLEDRSRVDERGTLTFSKSLFRGSGWAITATLTRPVPAKMQLCAPPVSIQAQKSAIVNVLAAYPIMLFLQRWGKDKGCWPSASNCTLIARRSDYPPWVNLIKKAPNKFQVPSRLMKQRYVGNWR